jgi:hypothetical protein
MSFRRPQVVLLPNGWGESLALPEASWFKPGGTWAYGVIGGRGVFVMSAALFWVAYFALEDNARPSKKHGAKAQDEISGKSKDA